MFAEAVYVKQELEGEHGESCARPEPALVKDPVLVKEEPKNEQESEELSCVKEEPSSELYADHVVKDELVLGPERPHRPTGGYVVQGWAPCDADGCPQAPGARRGARRVMLKDCCVRLERLLSHEAMPPYTEHRENGQKDVLTTHTDTESDIEERAPVDCEKGACNICSAKFPEKSDLVKHVMSHIHLPAELEDGSYNYTKLVYNPYACDICNEDFSVKQDLLKHVAVHIHMPSTEPEATSDVGDSDQSSFPALERDTSPRETTSVPSGAGHETRTQAIDTSSLQGPAETIVYMCDMCGHLYKRKQDLIRHIRRHLQLNNTLLNETEYETHTCNICKKKFKSVHTLKMHSRVHTGERPYYCEICNRGFIRSWSLKEHLLIHTGEKRYSCEACNMKFRRSGDLNKHKRTHTGERPYSCQICKKKFAISGTLKSHLQTHSGDKLYSCEICNKRFKLTKSLRTHIRSHIGEGAYSCEICEKKFILPSLLKTHLLTHSKTHVCDTCGKGFAHPLHLNVHLRIHTGERPFCCKLCKKRFTQSSNLKRHMRIHSREKPFQCDICNKRFTRLEYFQIHIRIHTGDRPYSCGMCGMKFTRLSILKLHKRRHTGEKPYSCEVCQKKFSRLSNLKSHLHIHDKEKL